MMRFTCPRAVLSQSLKIAARAIKSRSPFPVTEMIRFTAQGEGDQGSVSLYATDTEFAIATSFPAQVAAGGWSCLPAKRITEIVAALPEQPLQVKCSDDLGTTITAGKITFRMTGMDPADMPLFPTVQDEIGISLPESLWHRMLKRVVYATSKNDSHPRLTGSCLTIADNYLELAATDSHMLGVCRQEFEGDLGYDLRVIIPREAQLELLHLTSANSDETVNLWLDSQQLVVSTHQWWLKTRMIDGDFPKYDAFFPKTADTEVEIERAALIDSLKRVQIVAKDDVQRARCQFNAGTLKMKAVAGEHEVEEELTTRQSGADLQIVLNAGHVLSILETFGTDHVRLIMNGALRPIWIKPVGATDLYSAINMPMNPE